MSVTVLPSVGTGLDSVTAGLVVVSTVENAAGITTQLLGIAAMAALLAAVAALAYRAFADEQIPRWLAVSVGVAIVALYLGTAPALETVLDAESEPSELATALFNVGALLLAGGGAVAGRAVGDRFGVDVLVWSPTQESDDVSQLAQTVGQVTTVSLPATIEDAPGYDPIPDRRKEALEGKQFVFPRGLTVDELETRIREQLRSDYGIGTADMQFDEAGDLSFLAVGTRAAGIGSTLPPATNAIAVRADPGFSASTGDIVQVWEPESMQRILTGELRGVSEDVVTIAIDASDTPKVDPSRRYRLVTLPVEDRPDREFASLLRAAEETFSSVTIEAGSPLHGLPVGALDLTITAIRPEDGDPVPFPDSEYRLAPGDLLFVIARPGELRRLESGAKPLDLSVASGVEPSLPSDRSGPAEAIQTGEPTATERDQPTGEGGLPADAGSGPSPSPAEASGEPGAEATETTAEATTTDVASAEAGSEESPVSGQADADSFQEIKAQFEQEEAPTPEAADEQSASDGDEPTSFDELKSEFESGEADWDDGSAPDQEETPETEPTGSDSSAPAGESGELSEDVEIAFDDDESGNEGESGADDELVSLEEADISFDDGGMEGGDESAESFGDIDIDDDLQGDGEDSLADDIGDLDFEEESDTEDVSEFDLSDDDLFSPVDDETEDDTIDDGADGEESEDSDDDASDDGDSDDGGDNDSDDGDSDDDGGSSGGGTSFAQLKEEFESGEADWEEDVSDSPGGDMRLDE